MKIRATFVTNSSSSSFLLAFKSEEDYLNFKNYCFDFCYNDFFKLVETLTCENKEEMKNWIEKLAFTQEFRDYIDKHEKELGLDKCEGFRERFDKECELQNDMEIIKIIKNIIQTSPKWLHKLNMIDESLFVVQGWIVDYGGGLLEWAIRRGFIKENFNEYLVHQENIG